MSDPAAFSKRPIHKRDFAFLRQELDYWQRSNLLSEEQVHAIGGLYDPSKRGRMSQALVALGAMLVGLGFLSWVAANWMEFSRVFRVGLILTVYVLSILSAWQIEFSLPKTSRALLLLGSFVYGGGIFLIAQIFNEGGHYTTALFWWMVGIVPAALLFRDGLQLVLLQAVALVYINGFYSWWHYGFYEYGARAAGVADFLWRFVRRPEPLLVVLILWGLWWFIDSEWSFGFNLNVFIVLTLLGIQSALFFNDIVMFLIFGVLPGTALGVCAFGRWKGALGGWGVALLGLCGLVLTIPEVWHRSRVPGEAIFWMNKNLMVFWAANPEVACSIGMAIFVGVAMLWFVNRGIVVAVPFFCLLILRYYFDRFYDFMPKAIFFTVGGLILAGMGFWLEHLHRKRREKRWNAEVLP
ncbi:MAG: DUF2157 domain-containing protein [Synergistaceae bacterium]|jgi:uncharacterized membrane protein|nr:DUF2157 domain-containing protein [Synergistaceae bacterium]